MMRRSALKPGGSLKQGKPLQRRTPMRQTGFSRAGTKTPSAGAGLKRAVATQAVTANHAREPKLPRLSKPMRSRGMKGRPPTAEEARFMDRMGKLPCIACQKDGWENHVISLHHIDGRTKPGAHFLVLPLCAGHHQQGTGPNRSLIAVHPNKGRFEERYGTQMELLDECGQLIGYVDAAQVDICDDHENAKEAA